MNCAPGDLVYVALPAGSPDGYGTCSCNLGAIFTVHWGSTNPSMYPGQWFWDVAPSLPACRHYRAGISSVSDDLLRPIRGPKKSTPMHQPVEPEKIGG